MHSLLGILIAQGARWLSTQFQSSGGRKLNYVTCAVRPGRGFRVLIDHPDAVPALDFINMLQGNPQLAGFSEDVVSAVSRYQAQNPGCDIYIHSPRIV